MADELRQRYRVEGPLPDQTLEQMATDLQLHVFDFPLGPLSELVVEPCIYLNEQLSRPWRRVALAHALGHVLRHCGNQMACHPAVASQQERQADCFAGRLLIGPDFLEHEPHDLADYADVPAEFIDRWLRISAIIN